jgi:hypothetical protein
MSANLKSVSVLFPDWYDDRAEWEHSRKGFLPGVVAELPDGRRYQLYFMDPVRLGQDAEAEFGQGSVCFTEPGLVLIPEVTREAVRAAVAHLHKIGYFEQLRPLP